MDKDLASIESGLHVLSVSQLRSSMVTWPPSIASPEKFCLTKHQQLRAVREGLQNRPDMCLALA